MCLGIKSFSQGMIILNESLVLDRNGDNDEALYMKDAGSLRKEDAIVDRVKDGGNDILLRMGDAGSDRMGDESGIFSRDSRMNDELFIEVEDEVIERCNDK